MSESTTARRVRRSAPSHALPTLSAVTMDASGEDPQGVVNLPFRSLNLLSESASLLSHSASAQQSFGKHGRQPVTALPEVRNGRLQRFHVHIGHECSSGVRAA